MGRSRDNWSTHRRKIKNKESLPKNAIRKICNYRSRGVSVKRIHEILTEQKEISASYETLLKYIEDVEKDV
ncbi:hypothetical protein U0E09_33000 [Bacillus thuringiensis]|uniref:hypothetical protein n=1 Tax=Bacillus TaxID=1386 RepID=UPI0005C75883|nr:MULTISPECIES: hypothetical protein [Bacillus]MBN6708340.1 hypothetical protein [Bacillus thuringiensis]MDQ7259174.1 hypothetical protein [Bacillus thuringiensis]MDV6354400.1 hypothetical protein [Bacillus thuringiensis]MDY7954845.1 hypothetical protein [Bacillus thuringiensis]PQZ64376.1 hypothetical protein CQ064_32700 [Bacillus sp. MYb78]